MHYGEIKNCDIANGNGVRVSLFVSGCTNACKGCFQPQTWDFSYGKVFTDETIDKIIKMLEPSFINGLTLLGGDPFEPKNQPEVLRLVQKVKATYADKDVWAFTGFALEDLKRDDFYARCECTDELLSLIDVLVDGKFVEELYDISLRFRGSSNQRIMDLKKTLQSGKIVLWND